MGCIVNGPGEMADADFGYVGGAPGKIDLYVGKVTIPSLVCQNHLYEMDSSTVCWPELPVPVLQLALPQRQPNTKHTNAVVSP